jgi:hypothetical protein
MTDVPKESGRVCTNVCITTNKGDSNATFLAAHRGRPALRGIKYVDNFRYMMSCWQLELLALENPAKECT